ncbi:peptide/nickel transport system ATP-binding protein/oligopeptide transport system ATP-binding protein [Marinobacter daqiaonensis]|uniref:ABC-type dipeptide transporter n=2 Tax=Marinobacter daqiaonensis TaxID=650891 RepID=A0A1I6I0D1_9GAMM|nr:ABC transporter ATP-binding protein [Marinobacter daqiaonensis]SFR60173.1 peptide/nickel transport system ATP-binding protein/oligopeptide transport system ATP-binding protein [Marinobacter daqiaonensis]
MSDTAVSQPLDQSEEMPVTDPADALLQVENLHTVFRQGRRAINAVNGVSFSVGRGETLAIVGESGSGKSVTAMSLLRLIPSPPGEIIDGDVYFDGRNLLDMSEDELRSVRGNEIAMIFQEPMTSLNPVLSVRQQLAEPMRVHRKVKEENIEARCLDLLRQVRIPDPEARLDAYPHQFSGGMRQRVMIAMALACEPRLLIADEPTTALDVTVQAQILELLKDLTRQHGSSMILITHDLGVVARYADRINVMYAGQIVESGTALEIFENPRHPYTLGLIASMPRLDAEEKARLKPIEGQPPDLGNPPAGCAFHPRCPFAKPQCREQDPPLEPYRGNHLKACWVNVDE